MTEKELDLYAKWESIRMRADNREKAALIAYDKAGAKAWKAVSDTVYGCMKDLAASANDYEGAQAERRKRGV